MKNKTTMKSKLVGVLQSHYIDLFTEGLLKDNMQFVGRNTPMNPYDPNAILISLQKINLGYVCSEGAKFLTKKYGNQMNYKVLLIDKTIRKEKTTPFRYYCEIEIIPVI